MQNPDLPTIRRGYAGNAFHDGRFTERYMSSVGRSFWPVLRWKLSPNPKARAKREDGFRLAVRPLAELPDRDCLVWLGHASFLLRAAWERNLRVPDVGEVVELDGKPVPSFPQY